MLNVTKASVYKMFHDKAFWICMAGTVAWAIVVIMAQVMTSGARGLTDVSQLANRWYGFVGLHCVEVPLIISAVILFTGEYRDKSWKLFIAKGISRASYYFAKLICMLLLTVIITFLSLMTVAISNIVVLHAAFDVAYVWNVLQYILGQTLAHCSIAMMILMVISITKRGEIASILSLGMMIFGYVMLHGVESAMGLGEAVTDAWAFSMTAFVEFAGPTQWGRLLVAILGYLVVCSLVVITWISRRDIE
ncbi:MAG: ABC transporter permease [Lachnospiraceae bacterium]|nr:ABC transporter permease [Lachnospiraceae bacterium]